MTNRFKTDLNQYLTSALFYEKALGDKVDAIYTLKEEDFDRYQSLHRLYMEMGDLTEYEFANTYLGGWTHWVKLNQCDWFKPLISQWREELQLKTTAEALKVIKSEARSGGRNAFQANKILIDRPWEKKATKGRPSKADVTREAKRMASEQSRINEDYERIMGNGKDV